MSPGFPIALKISAAILGVTTLLALALIDGSSPRVRRPAQLSNSAALQIFSEAAALTREVAPNVGAFGFLEFDWDTSGGNGVPGFDNWPGA